MSEFPEARPLLRDIPRSLDIPVLALAAAGALIAGLVMPMLSVEKGIFFGHEYSIFTATFDFFEEGSVPLGILVVVTVIVLPITRLIALAVLWLKPFRPAERERIFSRLAFMAKWSMADVFTLAVLVVGLNLRDDLNARAEIGAAVFFGGVLLSSLVLWRANRLLARHEA